MSDTPMKVLRVIAHMVETACRNVLEVQYCVSGCTVMLLAIAHLHETIPILVLCVESWQPADTCIASMSQSIDCKHAPYAL